MILGLRGEKFVAIKFDILWDIEKKNNKDEFWIKNRIFRDFFIKILQFLLTVKIITLQKS